MTNTTHDTDEATKRQHTPGPWQQHSENQPLTIIGNVDGPDDTRYHYTTVCEVTDHEQEAQANSRLIAAAPELLEALRWTESWIVKHGLDKAELINGQYAEVPILGTIRKAIAKARRAA